MFEFPPVNIKGFLVCLVSDTIFDFATKHHIYTIHEIEHHVFQFRLECFGVDEVEIYILVCGDLDPFITLDEIDEPTNIESPVVAPMALFREIVIMHFKEQNLT